MAYRRGRRKTWSFQARTARGWKQLSTGVTDRVLATRMERMWERLAGEFRAWDLLDPVLEGLQEIGTLFDLWERTDHAPHDVRRLLEDRDLEPLVADWHAVYCRKHPDTDSPAHALVHVRALLPAGQVRNVSAVTTAWLTERLYAYPAAAATLKKVHASWSVFFDYCTRVRGLFTVNPMAAVEKPDVRRGPIQFYDLETVKRIVEAQPDPARRALVALLYGTGAMCRSRSGSLAPTWIRPRTRFEPRAPRRTPGTAWRGWRIGRGRSSGPTPRIICRPRASGGPR